MEVKEMNIYEKLSAISIELSTIAKNLNVGTGKSSYKAVGEADVLRAVKPLECKYRVYSYPFSRKIIDSDILVTSQTYNDQTVEKKQLYMRIEVVYRFVNIDKTDEFIDITTYGDGIDSGDKGTGKAMTYADKYALLKAYKIVTGDDPDQVASEELKSKGSTQKTEPLTNNQKLILAEYYQKGKKEYIDKALEYFGLKDIDNLNVNQASSILKKLKERE